jgi:predicted nuclease with TOPRIM domain
MAAKPKAAAKKTAAKGPSPELMARMGEVAVEEEAKAESAPLPANADELVQAAEEAHDLKDEIDRREAETKQLKDRYDQLRKQVIPDGMKALNMLNSQGKGSFTFSRGKIHLEQKLYASCTEENRPKLIAFLRQNGDADIVKETVNAQTLSAYIRERRGEGLNDPPGVSVHEEVTAKMTKR